MDRHIRHLELEYFSVIPTHCVLRLEIQRQKKKSLGILYCSTRVISVMFIKSTEYTVHIKAQNKILISLSRVPDLERKDVKDQGTEGIWP